MTENYNIINLWKAFCLSRKALAVEFDATDAIINKWINRLDFDSINQITTYLENNITKEGHVLDDPF
ncbi:MAG: hypothetical protein ACPKPY_02835 [Nitrososphaeraceae archaeon]